MRSFMKSVYKNLFLMVAGGLLYAIIELAYRGSTHWSMIIVGGICFYEVGFINEDIPWNMPLPLQMLIGMVIVTTIEFAAGLYLNLILEWNVWDYSNMPYNLLGQICLPFCIIWYFLSAVAIILDDWLRYLVFGEERPRYYLWF